MSRITIDIAADEFDFVKTAIENKTIALINYMEHCKNIAQLEQMRTQFPIDVPAPRGRPAAKKTVRRTRK